ncbi:MAG: multidrug efflux RND transporter permease subunit [Alphaproteobacteria bacterium]|nr:multidrug efflux RND transporter permease subunit [Alphaproteobacteria bacterium]
MKFPHFFIKRPVFATVVSLFIMIVGGIAYFSLPVSQYPEVAPPTIVVTAQYPGASAQVIADTVATPIEQEINGVEDMIYMFSQSTSDGRMTLTITFELGTDLDKAQVLVQNRVQIAEPRLPEEVRRLGVTTRKSSPDLLLVIHMLSPDQTYDQLYISNYALLQVRDALLRVGGVGDINIFGARDYSMRVWLDPDKISSIGLTAADVIRALRQENIQVAGGSLGQPPLATPRAFQTALTLRGRLTEAREFEEIVVKTSEDGRVTKLRDVARIELGARDYVTNSYLDGKSAVAMVVNQRPGSNALATAEAIQATMVELEKDFPKGLAYEIIYNPTEFIAESIQELIRTIFEAVVLVVLVVLLFLQTWRASIIPIIAIPVSLIGTFAVMAAFGFSINNLTLFGLVLAVGIVVDDAIVVVENVERNLRDGLSPREAAHKTMDEVGGALISMTLVLSAVFIPTAFISGISGQFYQQFALTIAVATIISAFNSLTLSPALSALLLKEHEGSHDTPRATRRPLAWFYFQFNRGFEWLSAFYAAAVRAIVRRLSIPMLIVYAGLIGATAWGFTKIPTGFIPAQDQGYLITAIQLPEAASLTRTDEVINRAEQIILDTPGIVHTATFSGFSGATRVNASNAGAIFAVMAPFEEREEMGLSGDQILADLRTRLLAIQDAFIFVVPPPPVRGIGTAGGFKMMVQDRRGRGIDVLDQATNDLIAASRAEPGLTSVYTPFQANVPQLYLEVERTKAQMLNVPVENIFQTLEIYLGSSYVNDFNLFGRVYRVTAQADSPHRLERDDIARLRTRSLDGDIVPLGTVVDFRDVTGPDRSPRYNLYPAAEINGDTLPGVSSGEAIAKMERLAAEILPEGISFEWTDLAFQEKQAGNTALFIFPLCVLFVFLVLAAQYESWSLPLSIILIVPMCLASALGGVALRGMDNNILTQIGFVVLVGLASKNAILIVEFARALEREGRDRFEAAVEACRLRLRPILMTSFAFILGVVPLMIASGAGAEMRQAIGTAVFYGMLGVTFFGLLFTPVFFVVIRGLVGRRRAGRDAGGARAQPAT